MFFLPCFVAFEETGNNMFDITLNGVKVGVVSSVQEAEGADTSEERTGGNRRRRKKKRPQNTEQRNHEDNAGQGE